MTLKDGIFGEEGQVTFKAPNTSLAFDSADVKIADDSITFEQTQLFVTGDVVTVTVDSATGSVLPTPLAGGTDYYVIVVDTKTIKLAVSESDALAGTALVITAVGTGKRHSIALKDYSVLANARGWSLNITKAVVDVTTLDADTRSYKAGLRDASGTMDIFFEASEDLASQKAMNIFNALLLPYDDGTGSVELYISTSSRSGKDRKIVADCIFSDFSIPSVIGGVFEFSANFRLNGDIVITGIGE